MKNKIALLLSIVMTISSAGSVYAGSKSYADREYVISEFIQAVGRNSFEDKSIDLSSYNDGDKISAEYEYDISLAIGNGIVTGYEDNTIRPNNLITRAEAAVILSRCLGDVAITQSEKHFTDVPQWASEDVNKLTQGGIINGYDDTTFGSKDNITVEQVAILTDKVEAKVNKNSLKDDYYEYYRDKFKRNQSLKGRKSYGSFDSAQEILDARIEDIISQSSAMSDEDSQKIAIAYDLFTDTSSRDALGIEPLKPYIERIDSVTSLNDIPELEAYLYKELNISPLFNYSVESGPKDSSKNVIQIGESSVILDRDYYFSLETEASKNAYYNYVTYILSQTGDENASALSKKLYDFEKSVIQKSGTNIYSAYGTVCQRNELNNYSKGIDTESFLNSLVGSKGSNVAIYNSEQLSQMSAIAAKTDIGVIKAYYKANIITAFAPYLSSNIVNSYYSLYNTVYGGSKPSIERRAVSFIKTYANSSLSRKYAEKYYDSQKEQDIKNMINEIRSYYEVKINNNTWLSDETKAAAVSKLKKMTIKSGYFKGNLPYASQLVFTSKENGGTLMGNIISVSRVLSNYYINQPDTPVDKTRWPISALMVNACYVPTANEIVIPMGIMEKPFYDEKADYYVNLASIGSVIAHEISHAFDPMGASFDPEGNRIDWWTEADKNKFYDLADKAIVYFGKYEVVNGIDNDGSNTLLENVSDLSGLSCIIDIAKDKGVDTKIIMKNYARLWSEIYTDDYLANCVKTDSHSVSKIRVNAVLSSIDEFYQAYGITQGDGMYVAPENRVSIW